MTGFDDSQAFFPPGSTAGAPSSAAPRPGESNPVREMLHAGERLEPIEPAPGGEGAGGEDDPAPPPPGGGPDSDVFPARSGTGAPDLAGPPSSGEAPETADELTKKQRGAAEGKLGAECPVTPLGSNGDYYFFLDHRGAFRSFTYEKLLRAAPNTLLGPETAPFKWAWRMFPTRNKEGEQVGWSEKNCGRAFMIACSLLDVWKGLDRVRGAGAWKGEKGELILNLGNEIMIVPAEREAGKRVTRKPGVIGRHVYPADDPQPRPWAEPVEGGPAGPGDQILEIYSSWQWERPEVDPLLNLGWDAQAFLGGALHWHASALITGDKGTGKSTLEEARKHLHGQAIVESSDATAASLWTALGYSSVPCAIDEFEAAIDDRRVQAIIQLMRVSSSGAVILRGSADHKLASFNARSPFLFSGVAPPQMESTDLSRLAVLELKPLPEDAELPDVSPARMRELGAKLRRRMIDNWYRWPQVFETCREMLKAEGHDARGADQFGTLLAGAEIALWDERDFSVERIAAQAKRLSAGLLSETSENESVHQQCLSFILSSRPDHFHGGVNRSVAQWLRAARFDRMAPDPQKALASFGLRFFIGHDDIDYLAIANRSHRGVQAMLAGSKWGNTDWGRLLRRIEGARALTPAEAPMSIGGIKTRATLVPYTACIDEAAMKAEDGF